MSKIAVVVRSATRAKRVDKQSEGVTKAVRIGEKLGAQHFNMVIVVDAPKAGAETKWMTNELLPKCVPGARTVLV